MTPREAAHETMDEVAGALIAIGLVLLGVFLPTSFIPGISGQFYKQFALTIVSATMISGLVSLSLSPAIAALLLKPRLRDQEAPAGLEGLSAFASRTASTAASIGSRGVTALRPRVPFAGSYRSASSMLVLIALAAWRLYATPTGFIPSQDQNVLIAVVQLPPGSSLPTDQRGRVEGRRDREEEPECPDDASRWLASTVRPSPPRPTPGPFFLGAQEARKPLADRPGNRSRPDGRHRLDQRRPDHRHSAATGTRPGRRRRLEDDDRGSRGRRLQAARDRRQRHDGRRQQGRGHHPACFRHSTPTRRRSPPTSTASAPSRWACRSRISSPRSAPISARPTSTTSISSAAPSG